MFLMAVFAIVVPHLYLNKEHAKQLLTKWKPQIVAGNIISVTGVQAYANAVIAMEQTCSGALVRFDAAPSFFVVKNDNNVTIVSARIVSSAYATTVIMHDLRSWHEKMFPDAVLIDGQMNDPSIF